MADYKKSNDHLANSCLAAPVLLATGNIGAAVVAVGLGKLLDIIDDQNYEERRKEWEKNPHRVVQLTEKEKESYWKDHRMAKKIIKELPDFKNAEEMPTGCKWDDEETKFVTIHNTEGMYTFNSTKNGSITFHHGFYDDNGYEEKPAKLYKNAMDFLKAYNKDLELRKNIKCYRIGYSYRPHGGEWMYTVDGGNSYVVLV